MAVDYRYRAWSRSTATEVTGVVSASSVADARRVIASEDLLVLDIAGARSGLAQREVRFSRRKVRPRDVAWLTRQLAITERAGLPITRALDTIAHQQAGSAVGSVVTDIARRLADGEDLATAFGAHAEELGAVTGALVAAGVAGGLLAATFERLAEMSERQMALRRKVRGALTYPAVVAALSAALGTAMLVFVVPTFRGLYAQLNGRLPVPTLILLGVSGLIRSTLPFLLLVVAISIVVFRRWRADADHAAQLDRLRASVPLLGPLVTKAAIARVAATLAGLLTAGVTTIDALDIAGDAAGLLHISTSLRGVAASVRNGRNLAVALAGDGLWPDVMVQLVQIGEETGRVGELLGRYADVTEQDVAVEVDRVVSLIEPMMVVGIGLIVAVTVICLYLPLFDLINLVR
jgi:type IV pilus assembly protein PilC